MRRACLYFGVEAPDPAWAAALADVDVVLEPYHPLVKDGGYADSFPLARRYVYVNPTTVDPWLLEQGGDLPPIAGRDPRWGLPRLDLHDPAAMAWSVATAVAALRADGGRCRGLFVDDLDRLTGGAAPLALRFLGAVEAEAGPVHWFVNRAFPLWSAVERLDAVLLEDIAPSVSRGAGPDGARWLREVVIPAAHGVRSRAAVHALAYADQERTGERDTDPLLEQQLRACIDSVLTGADRAVSSWRLSA